MTEAHSESSDGERVDAGELFAAYLAGLTDGGLPSADEVCAAYPEHAVELRSLCDGFLHTIAAMRGDAEGTVHGGAGQGDSAWKAFIEQLKSRGPAYSRYTPMGEVARGGMGVIQQVFDQDVRRTLAMKVMLGQSMRHSSNETPTADDRTLGRFLEEAQVTGQLEHPGIVPVHEVGVDPRGQVYFTMKLVKGEDLRSVFDRVHDETDSSWNQTRALGLILRVCEAMAYAHDKQVVHRDLKPANVMVGSFGEVYVMDWGLARVLDQEDKKDIRLRLDDARSPLRSDRREFAAPAGEALLTMDGDVVGTPAYMPIEQAEGRTDEVGPAADIYALGAMLYHLLAGHMPYARPGVPVSGRRILAKVLDGPPPPVAEEAVDAPGELIAICDKAMARDAARRYVDMTQFAADLRAFLEDRVVAAYESGAWAELRKWVLRNTALSMTAGAALFAVLALSGWALIERDKAKSEAVRADGNATLADRRADEAEDARNEALASEEVATKERDRADARSDDVLRLSDARRLAELKAAMADLWPAQPDRLVAMADWLGRARELLSSLHDHERKLGELRALGKAAPLPPESEEVVAARERLAALKERLSRDDGHDREDGLEDPSERVADKSVEESAIAAQEAELSELMTADLARRELARDYEYGASVNERWWHDALRDLVMDLHAFQADTPYGQTLASVEARREFAANVMERTVTGAHAANAWARARAEIRVHPKYRGLELSPQLGLLPLGPDPESTLWEFWHVQSGARPERDESNGRWRIDGEVGLILVLIPGGTFWMGAQSADEAGPNFDRDAGPEESNSEGLPAEVTLSAYFLSKFELTQGQWERAQGENPSYWAAVYPGAADASFPVDHVDWDECEMLLAHQGLVLPTDAQWERACRAETAGAWSFGDDILQFSVYGNGRGQSYAGMFVGANTDDCDPYADGHGPPARVGTFEPNGYGLFDMHGNVWEWCMDAYTVDALDTAPARGDSVASAPGTPSRVYRGGSCTNRAFRARSAYRSWDTPDSKANTLGVRPARPINTAP